MGRLQQGDAMKSKKTVVKAITLEEYNEFRGPEAEKMSREFAKEETEAQRQKREYIEANEKRRKEK